MKILLPVKDKGAGALCGGGAMRKGGVEGQPYLATEVKSRKLKEREREGEKRESGSHG